MPRKGTKPSNKPRGCIDSSNFFTEEEDLQIIRLKEIDDRSWDDISQTLSRRSRGSLQVRYSRSLQPGKSGRQRLAATNPDFLAFQKSPLAAAVSSSSLKRKFEEEEDEAEHSEQNQVPLSGAMANHSTPIFAFDRDEHHSLSASEGKELTDKVLASWVEPPSMEATRADGMPALPTTATGRPARASTIVRKTYTVKVPFHEGMQEGEEQQMTCYDPAKVLSLTGQSLTLAGEQQPQMPGHDSLMDHLSTRRASRNSKPAYLPGLSLHSRSDEQLGMSGLDATAKYSAVHPVFETSKPPAKKRKVAFEMPKSIFEEPSQFRIRGFLPPPIENDRMQMVPDYDCHIAPGWSVIDPRTVPVEVGVPLHLLKNSNRIILYHGKAKNYCTKWRWDATRKAPCNISY